MNRLLFSILHTSARPEKWREIYDAWIKAAVNPEQVEYVLCVDERWGFTEGPLRDWELQRQANLQPLNLYVWNTQRRCYVDGVNAAAKAASGRILIVNADDQYPCEGWDERLSYVAECAGDAEFVVAVSTGTPTEHEREILVMPILSRPRYDRLGYVLYPEYESMFADNEFYEHARQDRCLIDARHLFFPHRHAGIDPGTATWKKQAQIDEQYAAQNRPEAYQLGEHILGYRRAIRFGQVIDEASAIPGWMNRVELDWLSRAAYESGSVIEIGCWKGRSTYALAHSCPVVHAVDTWKGPEELPELQKQAADGSVLREFKANIGSKVVMHIGDSVAQASGLPNVGMVFLDGGHTYPQVKADLLAYMTKATQIICGHDFPCPEVRQAVAEVLGDVRTVAGTRLWYYKLPEGATFEIKPSSERRTIALCLSGEHFHAEYVDALLALFQHLWWRDFILLRARAYTSNVYATREEVRSSVLKNAKPPADLFLWIDDDNPAPTPEQFELLLKDLDDNPDVDGVTAWCWIYNKDHGTFQPSCGTWSPDGLHWRAFDVTEFPFEQKLRPVEATGFPCFLMRRSALEKAGDRPFLPILDERLTHGLMGEDLAFMRRAQNGGAKFLVDPRVRVRHLKTCDATPELPPRMDHEPVVAVMMRVKNESRWIERCIKSVIPLAGENIFVMDDESTDDTLKIARSLGVNVYADPFAGKPLDEVRDKEWLLSQVRAACDPDWILCIDGDEELEPTGPEKILRVLRTDPKCDVFALGFLFLWDKVDQVRIDGRYDSIVRESLFRPKNGVTFRSYYDVKDGADPKCHVGLHCGNAPNGRDRQLIIKPMAVFLLHYGYLFREDRIRKYNWYRSIDPENEYEDNYRHMVIGDLPEFPADLKAAFGGPLKTIKLIPSCVPAFDVMPEPLRDEVTA
jgi:glycosyltransferase involved in cell wall biosynthesis